MGRTDRLAHPKEFGKYQLIARLAHGRMGDVYKAKSHGVEGFEKILVVKVLNPGLVGVPSFVDTVIDQAKRSVALSHANVAQVYDLGRTADSQQFYIATEFVSGFDLGRAMKLARQSGRSWPQDLSIFIASEVAKGLDYAHRRKDFNFNNLDILHRDLAPQNIMISYDGQVKITDFGIAEAMDVVAPIDDDDQARRFRYAAPEVADSQVYSAQSDIFSLGVVLYEMLAGQHPYGDDDPRQVEQRARRAQIRPIHQHVRLPRQLQQILDSMLVPDPAGRAHSAGQIYEDLIGYLFGNHRDADSRDLGHLIEELRRDEQRLDPSQATQEVGLEEISITELNEILADSTASTPGVEDQQSPEVSAATHSALPSAKLNEKLADLGGRDSPPLPGSLHEHFLSARAGQGKALLVSGKFGSGRQYLSDRLVDVLGWRGNTRAMGVQTTQDDLNRPFGILSDLILRGLKETLTGSDDQRQQALKRLRELDGVTDRAVDSLGGLWSINPMPRQGYGERCNNLTSLVLAVLREVSQTGPFILVIDQIELIDRLTLDVLRAVVGDIGTMSVMLVMMTNADELMRSAFDVGQPEDLEAIRVVGASAPDIDTLEGLSGDAAALLMMLAICDQPLSQADLGQLLGLPGDRLMDSLEELVDRQIVRVPRTGIFMAGSSELSRWVDQRFEPTEIERAASGLARYVKHRVVRRDIGRLTPTLIRLYALAGDRRRVLSLADSYSRWLEQDGWLEVAIDFYGYVADLLAQHSLGSPQARIDYILSRAELALELSRLDDARASLEPIAALTEAMHHDRGLVKGQLLFGQMAMQHDDLDDALTYFGRAAQTARSLSEPTLLARSLLALAGWHDRYGHLAASKHHLEGAMNLFNRWGTYRMELRSRSIMLQRAIHMWADRGMIERAERLSADLSRLGDVCQLATVECRAQWARAKICAEKDQFQAALDSLETASGNAHRYGLNALRIELIREQAATAVDAGQYRRALAVAGELIPLAERSQDLYSEQRGRDIEATASCMLGQNTDAALSHLTDSLQRARDRHVPRDIHRSHVNLKRAFHALGHPDRAAEHRRQAQRLAVRMRYRTLAA